MRACHGVRLGCHSQATAQWPRAGGKADRQPRAGRGGGGEAGRQPLVGSVGRLEGGPFPLSEVRILCTSVFASERI